MVLKDNATCTELMSHVRTEIKKRLREDCTVGIKVFDSTFEFLRE